MMLSRHQTDLHPMLPKVSARPQRTAAGPAAHPARRSCRAEPASSVFALSMFVDPLFDGGIIRWRSCTASNSNRPRQGIARCGLARLLTHVAKDQIGQGYTVFFGPRF